jgi:hypothetical protein
VSVFRRTASGVAVIAIALLVLAAAVWLRPVGAGRPQATGPVVATEVLGPFELAIRSEHGQYAANEAIGVIATLTFHGPDDSVDISHDGGSSGGAPVRFGVEEPVTGNLKLEPISDLMCASSTLKRDVPLEVPFAKTGSFSDAGPLASAYEAYFKDPVLRLPAGTWHLSALADFGPGSACGQATVKMHATITILIPNVVTP